MDHFSFFFDWLSPYYSGMLVATGIGFIIGLEREFNTFAEEGHIAGLRTFPIIALLGFVTSFLSKDFSNNIAVATVVGLFLLISIAYFVQASRNKTGLTTELAMILTFVLGMMAGKGFIKEALATVVITTTILSLKQSFRKFISQMTQEELFAFIKFTILALLILPFLPDHSYGPNNLFNPREIGWIVVILSSINFIGYLLMKFGGAGQGILLTAFLGGLVSSTMVTWSFSARSKDAEDLSAHYSAGIVLASTIMYLRVLLIILIFNRTLALQMLAPCLLIALAGGIYVWWMMRKREPANAPKTLLLGNPLDMQNALVFTVIFLGILLMVYYADFFLGKGGVYLSGLLSGLADLDAVSISMSKLALQDTVKINVSAITILLAMLSNTVFKLGISVAKGSMPLRKTVTPALGGFILLGIFFIILNLL